MDRPKSLSNMLKEVINSVILLSQTERDIARHTKDNLVKTIALSKAEAYTNTVNLLQAKLLELN